MCKDCLFVVSVKDFGAQGDGVTNDTQAFTAAAQSGARVIKIPPGTYVLDGALYHDLRFISDGH